MNKIAFGPVPNGRKTARTSIAARFRRWARRSAIAAGALTLGTAFAPMSQPAYAASANTPWRVLSPGRLTAVWWQWAYSVPAPDNALFDKTGANAYNGQPYSDLVLLGGTFASDQLPTGDVLGVADRTIHLKSNASLFFPLINAEYDNTGCLPRISGGLQCSFTKASGVPQIAKAVTAFMDGVKQQDIYATWTPADANFKPTGSPTNILYSRLKSPPFSYTLPAQNNVYQQLGANISGTVAPAVGDGYFSFVPAGTFTSGKNYLLRFGGKAPLGATNTFTVDITYKITVTP